MVWLQRGASAPRSAMASVVVAMFLAFPAMVIAKTTYATKSGILPWVDPETPDDSQTYKSSRGDTWNLVMSDEFNTANRSFEPGDDHMFTSIEKPDGVNSALEYYSHNMTTTACDGDDCYFQIKVMEDVVNFTVWNSYMSPPGYQDVVLYYRSAMVQSWNKFCFQGGMIEVRAQLPAAVTKASGNPDISSGSSSYRATTAAYYPAWPGIWLLGNLGRSIFSASTSRMWPYSYNECNETVFDSQNQRISACNGTPGHGLNANQGRGAPEIDILEGGGTDISSSIQVAPGMPKDFRMISDNSSYSCMYTYTCTTKGANNPDVPTAYYESLRGHKSWYQGLRYGANNYCASNSTLVQSYTTIKASLDAGITENACTMKLCPGSFDVNADLDLMNGSTTDHWGINTNGTCYPKRNSYTGAFLCSPGNTDSGCSSSSGSSDKATKFAYQMDAISSNWPIQVGAYTGWLTYQLEWVMGDEGYVRWMLGGSPIFEIPADAVINPPQDKGKTNPKKIMIEEPMYIIFNVALSSTWGVKPPNPGEPCRGDGTSATTNAICDAFPMYLKIDYIRLFQDTSNSSSMTVGCDPKTHPTAQWIADHIDEYTDTNNPWKEVAGKGFCESNDDCTIASKSSAAVKTGTCSKNRCVCSGNTWKGPRCTFAVKSTTNSAGGSNGIFSDGSYGPPMYVSASVSGITVLVTFVTIYFSVVAARKSDEALRKQILQQQQQQQEKSAAAVSTGELSVGALSLASASDAGFKQSRNNYSTNFV